ncbi:MAG: DUF2080 family transposase-associated protein [Halobacteria archaeon]
MDRYEVEGHEVLEKEVKEQGGVGRVYLPKEWIGGRVKIVRTEEITDE